MLWRVCAVLGLIEVGPKGVVHQLIREDVEAAPDDQVGASHHATMSLLQVEDGHWFGPDGAFTNRPKKGEKAGDGVKGQDHHCPCLGMGYHELVEKFGQQTHYGSKVKDDNGRELYKQWVHEGDKHGMDETTISNLKVGEPLPGYFRDAGKYCAAWDDGACPEGPAVDGQRFPTPEEREQGIHGCGTRGKTGEVYPAYANRDSGGAAWACDAYCWVNRSNCNIKIEHSGHFFPFHEWIAFSYAACSPYINRADNGFVNGERQIRQRYFGGPYSTLHLTFPEPVIKEGFAEGESCPGAFGQVAGSWGGSYARHGMLSGEKEGGKMVGFGYGHGEHLDFSERPLWTNDATKPSAVAAANTTGMANAVNAAGAAGAAKTDLSHATTEELRAELQRREGASREAPSKNKVDVTVTVNH